MRFLIALLAGGASVFAYAPFGAMPLAFFSLAVLAALLAGAPRARSGFLLGFAWGFGAFAAGVSWLFVALHRYGGMPAPLAALAIGLFCAYLALFPGLIGALQVRLQRGAAWRRATLFAGLWTLGEYLRGVLFTGFPWLAVGYTQVPPSPLAGFLPVLGVYGVGALVAFVAALAVAADWRRRRQAVGVAAVVALLFVAGAGLRQIGWTQPVGEPLKVALLQTNIEQDLKWAPARLQDWLQVNARMVADNPAQLVVLPETTLPLLSDMLPRGYLDLLADYARAGGGDLVLGLFTRDADDNIYNAAVSLGSAPSQHYAKRHLVPFGEYSPPLFGWFYQLADIPMSDQTRGALHQPPLALGGQKVAVNICYEDLFGAELLDSLPEATLLLNISNLAWYGNSLALPQHLQIARARALETGRPMLRSTNTGMTAVVQPDGEVSARLPAFESGALHAEVRGYQGLTPYARWGDAAALGLAVLALLGAVWPRSGRNRAA